MVKCLVVIGVGVGLEILTDPPLPHRDRLDPAVVAVQEKTTALAEETTEYRDWRIRKIIFLF